MNCNCNDKAIIIVRGNDTNFNDGNFLTINLNTTILDLSTFKATFKLGSIFRRIDDISSGIISLNFTAAETSRLPQFCYGTLNLIDTSNRVATIESLIPFQVISVVNGNAIATEPYTLNFDVKQGGETILNVSVESAVTVEIGQTTTLPPMSQATVTNSGTGNHLILNFGIPAGVDGGVYSVNGKVGDVVLTPSDIGAQAEITEENKLNSDLVDDTDGANKFVSAEEKAQITTNKNDIIGLDQKIDSVSGALSDSITGLDNKYDSITGALDDKIDSINGALSDSITALDNKYDSITGGLSDSITALDNKYDSVTGALDDKIDSINGALSDSITALDSVVSGNYTTLDNKIDSVNGALSDSINALDSVVSANYNTLDGKIDSINGALSDSISAIDSTIGGYGNIVTHNVSEFATAAQGALADTAIQPNDNVSELVNDAQYINIQPVNTETTNRENADLALQRQIDAIVASSDVFDVVGTYAELQNYDISTVPPNDIIKVLVDSTHDNAATYYRCVESNNVKSWSYIGAEGAYYTKGEADSRFVPLTRTVNNKALSSNITLTASDVGALPDNTTIGDATLTIQVNSSTVDTFTANATSNKSINIQCATPAQGGLADTALQPNDNITELTNNAGYITNSALSGYATETYVDNGLDTKEDVFSVGDGLEFAQGGQEIQPVVTLPYTFTDSYTGVQFFNNLTSGETKTAIFKIPSTGGYYYIGNDSRRGIRISWSGDDIWLCDARSGEENNWEHFTASTDNYLKIISYNGGATDVFYSHDNSTWTLLMDKDRANQLMGFGTEVGIYVEGDLITVDYFKLYYGTGTETTLNVDNTIARVTDIPTNNNQLTNGAGYITSASLPTKVSDLTNDSGYITSSALTGYVTSTDLSTTLADYTLSSSLATVATTGSYNDLTDKPYIPSGVVVDQTYDATSQNAQSGVAIAGAGFALSSSLSTVATSGSYNDLSNKPTIPTVNNATLTIQKNGTTVKTFTANASSNVTCNITVPTNTNELTNGAGYITGISSSDVTTALGYTPYNSTNPSGYQANVIETVKVNGTALTPSSKAVDITVPTKVSDLTDDTATYPIDKADTLTGLTASITELNYCDGVTSAIQTQLNGKLTTSDIVSSVSSSSTNSKAVGAKLFYDTCGDIETLINAL